MKAIAILMSFALYLVAATAHSADSPMMGTWKLDEAKSKISAGSGKNTSVVYASSGDSVKITVDGVDSDSKPAHNDWIGKFDGKDYPVTGDPATDTRSYEKVDEHTLNFTSRKGGKVTLTGHIVVSDDGKTRTVTTTGTDSRGEKVNVTAIYNKQ